MSPWTAAEPGRHAGTGVWRIDLARAEADLARCAEALSPDERARMARYLRPEDRARFAASHAALRLILGRALGRDPRAIAFVLAPGGRPELAGAGLSFNLSHSGQRALVALSTEAPVGVDVETLRPLPDALRIARGHFAPDETASLARLDGPAREAAFFALWTRKEAVVKALGAGLALPLTRFSVSLPPGPPRLLRLDVPGAPSTWTLHHLEPGPGTVGALAAAAPVSDLTCRALPPDWPDLLP
ncbi:4'-phosphopantetheinyl transferase family protein [Methylobacterium dankookense]|uniref:4'-phosphopantetheinyl transferase Sfp n=1 Tax=Methylobacterium dankookense TaxID=560405 RepID=A0A564FXT4_9HYPH|nr:4'-phosphopantetheinyl transferase superfamily protein [Methylobacterium dankookense]GJD54294.1 4'-phosphopantetheinyl transferase Sfp [Methylobacterium dankookense]VUF12989.1 4'-phosphopantetheinyl transferase sfp [Methylobacterium dankookense]